MAAKPILISGAGLSSLLLAQGLKRASIPFQIFERDQSPSFRAQGYRLRLSEEGISAIESVLSPSDFERFWNACGKTGGGGFTQLNAIDGSNLEQPSAPGKPQESLTSRGGKVIGIARGEMRKQLLIGCEEYVHWGHNVVSYELTESGVRAIFADGSKSVEGDMLIGGEGIHSKIAKQVSGGKLKVFDTGARGIHGQAPTTAFKNLGEGVWRIVDDTIPGKSFGIITNVRPEDMDDPNVNFGWTMAAEAGVIQAPGDNYSVIGKPAASLAKQLTKNWNPKFQPLFDHMVEEEAAFWKITCSAPSGVPEWKNEPRVTVIGDAVHSMTPAGGIGANTAVQDSAVLTRLFKEAGGYAPGITAAYEKEMRQYGSAAVVKSYGLATVQWNFRLDDNSPEV